MYYRRKVILALLENSGGRLSKTDLQKLLFLFTSMQEEPVYDFLPFKYGCYSPLATQDLKTMAKYNMVEEQETGWALKTKVNYFLELKSNDQKNLLSFIHQFKNLRGTNLVRHVYKEYPFFAIKSEIKNEILTKDELKKVEKSTPHKEEPCLFTIGYEGKSVEKFITQLINEDVKVLCDIRKNPLSMKFGFSKNQLKGILEAVGIEYLAISGLGIESGDRKSLKTPADYENLFLVYENTTLVTNQKDLSLLACTLKSKKRIALTCFEADHHSCHRSRTAKALLSILPKNINLIHL